VARRLFDVPATGSRLRRVIADAKVLPGLVGATLSACVS
jgi:hypothetical protein